MGIALAFLGGTAEVLIGLRDLFEQSGIINRVEDFCTLTIFNTVKNSQDIVHLPIIGKLFHNARCGFYVHAGQ